MSHAPNAPFFANFPPPPPPSFGGGIRQMFEKSPILTILLGLALLGFLGENNLLEPALFVGFICLVFHLMSPSRSRFVPPPPMPSMPPMPPPPPPFQPTENYPNNTLNSAGNPSDLPARLEQLERQFMQMQSVGKELFKRTETLTKPRPRSFLAFISFITGLGSLSIPLAILVFMGCFSYLNHAEISPVFLHVFNGLRFDEILFRLKLVDFDFFATFFGVVLIPSLFLVMIALGISVRTLFKRQRGFFMAFFATGLFFISFLSLVGAWSGLIHASHRWQQEWQELNASSSLLLGTPAPVIENFQHKLEGSQGSFWKRMIAIKALKKINTPESYQALFQSLDHQHIILQQLILRQLEGQITLAQAPRIESLIAETSDRRFREMAVRLLSSIPEQEMTIRLLNMPVPLPPEALLNRFTEQDVPQLVAKLQEPTNVQKEAVFYALCSLNETEALQSLNMLASASDEISQRVVLHWIERNPSHPQRNTLLNQLTKSSFPHIHHPAKSLLRYSHSKPSKLKKHFRRSCHQEND